MDNTRLSQSAWDLLAQELFGSNRSWIALPQKLFVWNAKGVYIDYYYPNPIETHYIGGEHLLGKRITTILPPPMARGVQTSVFQTLDLQQPLVELYELTMNNNLYRVVVRFLPFQNNVLGMVNDYPMVEQERVPIIKSRQENKTALLGNPHARLSTTNVLEQYLPPRKTLT